MQRLLRTAGGLRGPRARRVLPCRSWASGLSSTIWGSLTGVLECHKGLERIQSAAPGRKGREQRSAKHDLASRSRDFENATPRSPHQSGGSFPNHLAERDLHLMKLHRKVVGSFRSTQWTGDSARLNSVLSTAPKRKQPPIKARQQGLPVSLADLRGCGCSATATPGVGQACPTSSAFRLLDRSSGVLGPLRRTIRLQP